MSETITTDAPAETAPPATETDAETLRAEIEKWKNLSRQNEAKAKANAAAAKELETVREASKTEFEKAVEAARNEGLLIGRKEAGKDTVQAEFRAAFARNQYAGDVDAYLDAVDLNRFMDDEGRPKADAISELVEKFAPKPGPASTAHVQATTTSPPALNGDPLLADLKKKLGIN